MRIAVIGQSSFAVEVCKLLKKNGNVIVGVFTITDKNGREDPLACAAKSENIPVFKIKSWRKNKIIIPEIFDEYKSVGAELNVLPFCSQYIPMEVITFPKHQTICYHPSILPAHRGASAINWTLMNGDTKGGFTIFWADDGLDTGPILLQRECDISLEDTVDSVYNSFMYPEGIKAMGEAVEMIKQNMAPKIMQPLEGATYDPMLNKEELREINWNSGALSIHNFIRGMDSSPGAWCELEGEKATIFGSEIWDKPCPSGTEVSIKNMVSPGIVHSEGIILFGNDDKMLNIKRLCVGGKMMKSSLYGQRQSSGEQLTLTDEELKAKEALKDVWFRIINVEVDDSTDFFAAGAGSMDVIRLIEEVKQKVGVNLLPEDVFMATGFLDFITLVVSNMRGEGQGAKLEFDAVKMNINNIDISFPRQLFINNKFIDPIEGKWDEVINPFTEEVICQVASGSILDVDAAVKAAEEAFDNGEWSKMNARDRGKLLYKLADVMEEHKEELATIESIDSGAVYTLALKTHVGMSIDTWRYFAGWCDKIEGSTIPINNARPNRNLTITRKEAIGVCGLVIPWNYPLMMLSWKMAACLATGNTVVIKPAEVTPLTALKFAELSVYAGIPPGVINIITGSGRTVGEAITAHIRVRKVGFTGSTNIGKRVMCCAALSNAKKVSLELGGKNPLIIFSDCDFDKAVRQGLSSVYFNKGENCIAAGRIFVEESIHDRFVQKVTEEVKKMTIGDPLDRGTNHGPQNHLHHLNKLIEYVNKGVEEGATLVYGGKRCDRRGYFYMPTIMTDIEDNMYVAREESFGPIMLISKFKNGDVEGVIKRSNNTEFGLAAGVFTKDIDKALYVASKIQAGTCFVNTYNKTDVAAPFGGFKQSGFGKDLGKEALNEYLKTKTITFEY